MMMRAVLLGVALGLPLGASGEGLVWSDWDGRQMCRPASFWTPVSEATLRDWVEYAYTANMPLKVVGAGHSFSPIALSNATNGFMVSLDELDRIVGVDGTTVTVQAGIRLHALNAELEKRGLALENLGATCEQSLAGATATGTHGTGRLLGSMSTQILGLRMILVNGTVIDATPSKNAEIFRAARVGLGALGVVTELTLRTLPLYKLRLNHTILPLDDLLAGLEANSATYERLQWYWQPPDEARATLITREVVDAPVSPGGCWDAVRAESPSLFEGAPAPQNDSCVDVSYKALCGSAAHYAARKLYTEMEMFVPTETVLNVIAAFREFIQTTPMPAAANILVGVRYVASDDIALSPQRGRDNAVVSVINTGTKAATGDYDTFRLYAAELERIASGYDARPHWGKMNYADALYIEEVYGPSFYEFRDLRAGLDPRGLFLNDYLRQRLGV